MKAIFTVIVITSFALCLGAFGQPCAISTSGGNCVGGLLTAHAQPNDLAKLR